MANVFYKDQLIISAGTVYDYSRKPGSLVAQAEGGKVIRFFEDEQPLSDTEKANISAFVEEAYAAPEGIQ